MMRGLLTKELRQHAYTLAFLFLMLLAALALIAGNASLRRAMGGGFAGVQLLHHTYVPLVCLVLGQILIATEFRQKTQLFLEGLPLPRWRMLAVKFTLGLVVVMAAIVAALFVAWQSARGSEAITPRFAALVALKSAGWVWFLYTLCFAHAFLGRYRVVFGVTLFFGYLALSGSGVRISDFGPFALVDERFAYERHVFPQSALAVTAATGLGFAALGFALGLVRDASVATLLAEKMSAREKIVMTLVTGAVMSLSAWLVEHYRTTTPVRIPGALEARSGIVEVFASAAVDAPTTKETAALQQVAPRAADELNALAEYLGCTSFPKIFIVHRRDFTDQFQATPESADSVIARGNFVTEKYSEPEFHRHLIYAVLEARTSGLAGRERNAWMFAGLMRWWPSRNRAASGEFDATWLKHARLIMPADFSPRHLAAWHSLVKAGGEHGGNRTEMLAAIGLEVLAQRHGEDARRRFLSATFGPARPKDLRGWLGDVVRAKRHGLRATAGVSEKDFVEEWRAAIAGAPPVP